MKITQARLKEVLNYDPETGLFSWVERARGRQFDKPPGCYKFRYVHIRIDNVQYYAHMLAWLYVTGEYPEFELDHKDTNKKNNKFDNLRPATKSENGWNKNLMSNNTSGIKGVNWDKQLSKWKVGSQYKNKRYHLGYFDDIEEATEVYRKFCEEKHAEFLNLG